MVETRQGPGGLDYAVAEQGLPPSERIPFMGLLLMNLLISAITPGAAVVTSVGLSPSRNDLGHAFMELNTSAQWIGWEDAFLPASKKALASAAARGL